MAAGRQTPQCGWEHGCWEEGAGVQESRRIKGEYSIGGQKYPNLPSMLSRFLSQRQRKILVRVAPVERHGHMSGEAWAHVRRGMGTCQERHVTQAKEASMAEYGGVW